jgi:hypothetical protein
MDASGRLVHLQESQWSVSPHCPGIGRSQHGLRDRATWLMAGCPYRARVWCCSGRTPTHAHSLTACTVRSSSPNHDHGAKVARGKRANLTSLSRESTFSLARGCRFVFQTESWELPPILVSHQCVGDPGNHRLRPETSHSSERIDAYWR